MSKWHICATTGKVKSLLLNLIQKVDEQRFLSLRIGLKGIFYICV